jgi:hypothetical protein
MHSKTQYGHTLLLDGFQPSSSVKRIERLHFSNSKDTPYDEAWLQRLIMHFPNVLPIDEIEPVFTPLIPICIELPTKAGFLDNLFVTPSGDLALIECKLWRNPEARRKVIAQVIDYARDMSSWTYEKLQQAISSTKPLEGSDETATRNLYELVSSNSEIDEVSFHDAVSRNLKRGRFLLLIVGDGIREGVEGMAEFLQQHAGFHFTLAFVELALFETPEKQYVLQPRVLARTTNIDRGIVTMDEDGRIMIKPLGNEMAVPHGERRTTITQELFFEQLEKECPGVSARLNAFIDDLAPHSVLPDFGKDSLILRWQADDGKGWNLGTITKRGPIFTDWMGMQANGMGLIELYKHYLQNLAALVPDAQIKKGRKESAWSMAYNGKSVTIQALLADDVRKNGWVHAIADFQSAVMKMSQSD